MLPLQHENNILPPNLWQKERKELLAQFMGLGVFDKLWQLATEEQHEVQAVLRNFAKTNYDEQLADALSQNPETIGDY